MLQHLLRWMLIVNEIALLHRIPAHFYLSSSPFHIGQKPLRTLYGLCTHFTFLYIHTHTHMYCIYCIYFSIRLRGSQIFKINLAFDFFSLICCCISLLVLAYLLFVLSSCCWCCCIKLSTHAHSLTHTHRKTLNYAHAYACAHVPFWKTETQTKTETLTWFLLSTFSVVRAKLFSSSLSSPNWIEVFRFCLLEVVAQQSWLLLFLLLLPLAAGSEFLCTYTCMCVCVWGFACIYLLLFIEIRLTYFVAGLSWCWCGYR